MSEQILLKRQNNTHHLIDAAGVITWNFNPKSQTKQGDLNPF